MTETNTVSSKPDANRTQHAIGYYGSGGSLAEVGPLTNGQTVVGSTGNIPVATTITSSDSTLTITVGAGTLDIERTVDFGASAFSAAKSANSASQTGDGTVVTIAANTEIYDIGSDYNNGNYTYTAPTTGYYYLSGAALAYNLNAAHTRYYLEIVTSNGSYIIHMCAGGLMRNTSDNGYIGAGSLVLDMDASDTAYLSLIVNNNTKTVGIGGGASVTSSFNGWEIT